MTRVIFYTGVPNIAAFVFRFLQNKIYQNGQTALVAADEKTVAALDDSLWRDGFLPHARLGGEAESGTPILLASEPPPPEFSADVLLSLLAGEDAPPFAGQFPVYADVVGAAEAARAAGRKRYAYFRDHGYPLSVHKIGK